MLMTPTTGTATYFAVFRERGPAWDAARPMRQQPRWDEHAAFMDALADDGFVVLGGPLGDGDGTFLFLVNAESADAITARLAADPWTPTHQLRTARIERWPLLLGNPPESRLG
jgi:uncharacterized protein YciI